MTTINADPRTGTVLVGGAPFTLLEMADADRALWARLHVECAISRLSHSRPSEASLGEDLLAIVRANDVMAARALQHGDARLTDEQAAGLVVKLTETQKAAILALQNDLNGLNDLAATLDLSRLLAERKWGAPAAPESQE